MRFLFTVFALAASLWAGPKEDLIAAADALMAKRSYAWTIKIEGGDFLEGPHKGRVDATGVVAYSMHFEDADAEALIKGDHRLVKLHDGWKPATNFLGVRPLSGPPESVARAAGIAIALKTPAEEGKVLAQKLATLERSADGGIAGPLTQELVRELSHLRAADGSRPQIENVHGAATFYITDGVLSRYKLKYSGLLKGRFGELDLSRTDTFEISGAGATVVDLPPEALKILDAKP